MSTARGEMSSQRLLLVEGGVVVADRTIFRDRSGFGSLWCTLVYNRCMAKSEKSVRQSISLPSGLARRLRVMAKTRKTSTTRVAVELIEAGLEAREAERQRFFDLADRLSSSCDPEERQHIKEELARITFGD